MNKRQIIAASFLIAFFGLVSNIGLLQAQTSDNLRSSSIQPKPTNRLGAHFDQNQDVNSARRTEFGKAVDRAAGTYYSNRQDSSIRLATGIEEEAGLPLGSHRQRGSRDSMRPSTNSAGTPPVNPRIRNVGYPQQSNGNSFGQTPSTPNRNSLLGQTTQDGDLVISPCPVEFIDSIQLPALETGQIVSILVKEGDAVPAGKTVGQIDDQLFKSMLDQARLKHAIADQKANDNTSLIAAKNEIALAQVEYDRTKKLASTGSKSQSEYEKARFSLRLAMLKEVAAQNEKDSANGELQIEGSRMREVGERIRRHEIVAPSSFEGHVIEILRDELEWVNAGEPVMRIGRMDRLWVQGVVDASVVNPHEIVNRPVTVTLQLARGETTDFQGKIVHVGLERESSGRFLVKAEVQNRPIEGHWVLQPNSTVTMRIHLGSKDANTAAFGSEPSPIQNR